MWSYGYKTRRGSDSPNAKLSPSIRQEIKRRRALGETYEEIAQDLGVSRNTVRSYDQGYTYADE
jgi:DNA-binding CsgD family transcriptional regulator